MSVLSVIKSKLTSFIALFVAFFSSLFISFAPVLSTPVYAVDPITSALTELVDGDEVQNQNAQNNTPATQGQNNQADTQETPTSQDSQEGTVNICSEESGSLSWLVCPTTGFLAKITDGIYSIIEEYLTISPLTSATDSPFHQIWAIFRDITNIVFVILLLIAIISQLTGIGLSNYSIKKLLPKIVLTAILINLSYIVCSLCVDLSNILGASLRGLFASIESTVTPTGIVASSTSSSIDYTLLVGAFSGAVIATGFAIGATGGLGYVFLSLLPVLLAAVVSVIIAYITIATRQALVYVLIMVSPLAFVCYLLPNTSNWFNTWKKSLTQMLLFYPMFAALFGACSLVGWVIIAAAEAPLMLILGMAIKVVPLFLAWNLLKMSGTLPGQVNSTLRGIAAHPLGAFHRYTSEHAALRRAEYTAQKLREPFNFASGGSWRAKNAYSAYRRRALLKKNEDQAMGLLDEKFTARTEGRKLLGYDDTGTPIYKEHAVYDEHGKLLYTTPTIKATKELRTEYRNRELMLRNTASHARLDNSMSTMGTYLEQNNITPNLPFSSTIDRQANNYLELRTQMEAKRRNEVADARFYNSSVRNAAKTDDSGNLLDTAAYNRLITTGAGADAFVSRTVTDPELLRELNTARTAALASVQADAIDALEAERKAITAKYTTFLSKQVTKNVVKSYESFLENKDIEGICAAQSTLAFRGDYDKIAEHLRDYLDRDGYLELGSDFANVLALNLLGMKDADPELARLGKHINVETWAYTDWNPSRGEPRRSRYATYKEFMTGETFAENDDGSIDTSKKVKTKYFARTLLQGTGVKGIDRTFYGGLEDSIQKYYTADNYGSQAEADQAREALMTTMLPQIISALPTFAADSEQILNTLNFLTGMKNKNGKWFHQTFDSTKETRDVYDGRQLVYRHMVEKYLKGLTANDLIALKTNTYDAILAHIAYSYGYDAGADPSDAVAMSRNADAEEAARADLRTILEPQIRALRTGDQAQLAAMKTKIRTALGLL